VNGGGVFMAETGLTFTGNPSIGSKVKGSIYGNTPDNVYTAQ
jgi:hypothetical protein